MRLFKSLKIVVVMLLLTSPLGLLADPPDPGGGPGGDPVNGSAPIDGGSIIFIASAMVYGWRKTNGTFILQKNNGR